MADRPDNELNPLAHNRGRLNRPALLDFFADVGRALHFVSDAANNVTRFPLGLHHAIELTARQKERDVTAPKGKRRPGCFPHLGELGEFPERRRGQCLTDLFVGEPPFLKSFGSDRLGRRRPLECAAFERPVRDIPVPGLVVVATKP